MIQFKSTSANISSFIAFRQLRELDVCGCLFIVGLKLRVSIRIIEDLVGKQQCFTQLPLLPLVMVENHLLHDKQS